MSLIIRDYQEKSIYFQFVHRLILDKKGEITLLINMLCVVKNISLNEETKIIQEDANESYTKTYLKNYILNKPIPKTQGLLNQELVDAIGHIELNEFQNNWFLSETTRMVGEVTYDSEVSIVNVANNCSTMLDNWRFALWFVKDHSVNFGAFYSYYKKGETPRTLRIKMDDRCFKSNGQIETVSFSIKEMTEAVNWLPMIEKLQINITPYSSDRYSKLMEESYDFSRDSSQEIYESNNSFSRAMRFIVLARRQNFLPARVAFYISAIEAIITSDQGSLAMQVSEKTATLLSQDRTRRLEIHDLLRDAYKARSSYVHGDRLKEQINKNIGEISVTLDQITRDLLKKVITDYPEVASMKGEQLNKWYKENILFT